MREGMARVFFLMALLCVGGSAQAQSVGEGGSRQRAEDECACRAAGAFWQVGTETCMGGRLHVCGMQQNVLSWRDTGRACPSARRSLRQRLS